MVDNKGSGRGMVVISLNKTATKEFKELRKRIAEKLNLKEEDVSASLVIHELYRMYMREKRE